MASIFITGSADGLGQLAARSLVEMGHDVVLHARNAERAMHALKQVPGARDVFISDLSGLAETKNLAAQANAFGTFDAVIHNAGVYQIPANSISVDGLPVLFAVNTLAPYILTCLMHKPGRLIYLSSGMHLSGHFHSDSLRFSEHNKKLQVSYADTKLHDVMLTMAVARAWPDVHANAVNPGWVPTKMGGRSAPDNLHKGYETQVWLATSNEAEAKVSGKYFHHKQQDSYSPLAKDESLQQAFIQRCAERTGVMLPLQT